MEDDVMKDTDTKDQLLSARDELYHDLEASTRLQLGFNSDMALILICSEGETSCG